jgi:hypothetical protein
MVSNVEFQDVFQIHGAVDVSPSGNIVINSDFVLYRDRQLSRKSLH